MTDQRETAWTTPPESSADVAVPTSIHGRKPSVARRVGYFAQEDFSANTIRFRIRDLMIATAVFSVALALFRLAGIFGALLSFLTAVAFTITLFFLRYPTVPEDRARSVAQRRVLHDFIWGVCMPIVCLVFDPMFFRDSNFQDLSVPISWHPNDLGRIVYPYLVVQMLAMLLWLAFGWSLRRCAPFFAGVFVVGTLCAFAIGLLMLPLSLLGIIVAGIGLMGLTPLIAGWSYLRRLIATARLGYRSMSPTTFWISSAAGFMTAILLPLGITSLAFGPDKIWKLLR